MPVKFDNSISTTGIIAILTAIISMTYAFFGLGSEQQLITLRQDTIEHNLDRIEKDAQLSDQRIIDLINSVNVRLDKFDDRTNQKLDKLIDRELNRDD